MSTITISLPTGAKAELRSVTAGKKGTFHALCAKDGSWNGFGIVTDALAANLPKFVEINGNRIDLVSDTSRTGMPRVKAHNAPLSGDLAGKVAIVRLVDLGDGLWNYVVEVKAAPKTSSALSPQSRKSESPFS